MLDTRYINSLTDFLRNHKTHMARLKQTKTPEVLTVHGRPEAVIIDADSYQDIMDRLKHMESIATIRADFARVRKSQPPDVPLSEEEKERRRAVMHELMAETEKLGLYK